jgi:hypothetical protein
MKKLLLIVALLILLSPVLAYAGVCGPIVPQKCNSGSCGITEFFDMLVNVYTFIVYCIATPLAVVALVVGGVFILISAGNPNLHGTGKKIIWAAIIGLVLVFCSYLIIGFILKMIGFTWNWASPF